MHSIGETFCPACVRRHLCQKQIMKLGVGSVCADHGVDQRGHEAAEGRGCVLNKRGFDRAVDLLYMALMERSEDGSLVREVLIERADADTCGFGDAVGGNGFSSLSLQDANDSFENGVDGLTRAELLRMTAIKRCRCSSVHYASLRQM